MTFIRKLSTVAVQSGSKFLGSVCFLYSDKLSWVLILPHGGLELDSTTTTYVAPSRPGAEAVVVSFTSLGWPA